jgi:hypothetical protein
MFQWFKDQWTDYKNSMSLLHKSAYIEANQRPKRYYREGDVAPDSLLNRPPGSGPIGAMIAVDPETKIITKIFFP